MYVIGNTQKKVYKLLENFEKSLDF
jgi:hypothetical protein